MAGAEKAGLKESLDKSSDGASNGAAHKLAGDSHDGKPNDSKEKNAAGTEKLVKDGKLPPVDVTDHKQWTMAVLLSMTGPGDAAHPDGFGAETKLKQLKQMAKETEGKSVNFMVSVERSLDLKGQLCHQEKKSPADASACDAAAGESARKTKTERYFIHDGKIDQLPDSRAKTADKDLTSLLKDAQKMSPSDKLGLVVQSIGYGDTGLRTNSGPVSIQKLDKAIELGLDGKAHKKLDVLDLDACSMDTMKPLGALKNVADNIVASSAIERVTTTNDGQNLPAAFESLMANPAQSGREFSAELVKLAKDGANGKGPDNATITLAASDMSKYDQVKSSMDKFGQQLSKAMHNPALAAEIRKAVDETPTAPTDDNQRDLKSFARNISNIENLKDQALKDSAQELIKAYDSMAFAQFGEKEQGQNDIGGMSTYLPGSDSLTREGLGKKSSPLRSFGDELGSADKIKFENKGNLLKGVDNTLEQIGEMSNPRSVELAALKEIRQQMSVAKDENELNGAVKTMVQKLRESENSELGRQLAKIAGEGFRQAYAEDHKHPVPSITPGWDAFIKLEDRPY